VACGPDTGQQGAIEFPEYTAVSVLAPLISLDALSGRLAADSVALVGSSVCVDSNVDPRMTLSTAAPTSSEILEDDDFASTIGAGGVVGTRFVWPDPGPKFKDVNLTAAKEEHWKKWIALYNEKMLSKGEFKDLYVTGYDTPEAYAIAKDGKMYYGFFSPADWKGEIELRGLKPGKYRVTDYVEGKDFGVVDANDHGAARLMAEFKVHLLLEISSQP
jgi:hypothetical protein